MCHWLYNNNKHYYYYYYVAHYFLKQLIYEVTVIILHIQRGKEWQIVEMSISYTNSFLLLIIIIIGQFLKHKWQYLSFVNKEKCLIVFILIL